MTEQELKRLGRPPKDNPASATIPRVRVTPEKLAEYRKAAKKSKKSLSQWVRDALNKELENK